MKTLSAEFLRIRGATICLLMFFCALGPSAVLAGKLNTSALVYHGAYDRYIVRFNENAPERRSRVSRQNFLTQLSALTGVNIYLLRRMAIGADVIKTDRKLGRVDAQKFMETLANNPSVDYVELDAIAEPTFIPNDARYLDQWHYYDAIGGINLPTAWNKSTGAGVIIAVIDTGITPHSDLSSNVVAGYDFVSDPGMAADGNGRDSNPNDEGDWVTVNRCPPPNNGASNSSWHGTHVAGTIAAVTNNTKGVAGVAFNAKVLPLRVLGKCGGYLSDISDAIVWAVGGTVPGVPVNKNLAEVINLSLGGPGVCPFSYQAVINSAVAAGAVVVVAAGNSNANASTSNPANCNNVIAVAALGKSGAREYYSNYGSRVDVAAPGGGVLSTFNSGATAQAAESYGNLSGTSMAAPHVAGTVALMQSAAVNSPAAVETILKNTARGLPLPCNLGCGAGIVDASRAVSGAIEPILMIRDAVVTEGNSGATTAKFTVSVSKALVTPVSFDISVRSGSATAGSDYFFIGSDRQTFAPGVTTRSFGVVINGDPNGEANETFTVNVDNVVGVKVVDGQARGTILDDDGITLSIGDLKISEGNAGSKLATFSTKLSKPSVNDVSYKINTADGTGNAGSDYVASGLISQTISAGSTSKAFAVTINGDTDAESNETFSVNLSAASGANISDNQAIGEIVNDDGPTLSIADVSVLEGDAGTTPAVFHVQLSQPSSSAVTYDICTTGDATTTAAPFDGDYVGNCAGQTIPAGSTSQDFVVVVNGDTNIEVDETFKVQFWNVVGSSVARVAIGTIINDD